MNKILFNRSFGMLDFAIQGTKTQLRRFIRFPDYGSRVVRYTPLASQKGKARFHLEDGRKFIDYEILSTYRVGEIVAIAQSYDEVKAFYEKHEAIDSERYKAFMKSTTGKDAGMFAIGRKDQFAVKPNLMPHHVRILSLKTQKLQDITEEDCIAEGILVDESKEENKFYVEDKNNGCRCYFSTGRDAYAYFASQTFKNMRNAWILNPPVFVYTFETID